MKLLTITNHPCLLCGAGNTPNAHGETREFVDLEREVNWNDPVILCEDCVTKTASVIGMLSKDDRAALRLEIKERDRRIHDLQVEIDDFNRRATRLGIKFFDDDQSTDKAAA